MPDGGWRGLRGRIKRTARNRFTCRPSIHFALQFKFVSVFRRFPLYFQADSSPLHDVPLKSVPLFPFFVLLRANSDSQLVASPSTAWRRGGMLRTIEEFRAVSSWPSKRIGKKPHYDYGDFILFYFYWIYYECIRFPFLPVVPNCISYIHKREFRP